MWQRTIALLLSQLSISDWADAQRWNQVSQRRPFKDFQKPPQGGFFLVQLVACSRKGMGEEDGAQSAASPAGS